MKYWEIIADKLGGNGWTWGYCSAVTPQVDARREGVAILSNLTSCSRSRRDPTHSTRARERGNLRGSNAQDFPIDSL